MDIISVGNKIIGEKSSNDDLEICLISGTKGIRIKQETMANHVKHEHWPLLNENYHYCTDKNCPVIYYNNNEDKYFVQDDLITTVMHKIPIGTPNRPACYCKNVLEDKIIYEITELKCCTSLNDIQSFTKANTGKDCRITNPTGRCCGSQIKGILNWVKEKDQNINKFVLQEATDESNSIIENSKI
jgi:hypothetical protein